MKAKYFLLSFMLLLFVGSVCAYPVDVRYQFVGLDAILAGDKINVRLDLINFENMSNISVLDVGVINSNGQLIYSESPNYTTIALGGYCNRTLFDYCLDLGSTEFECSIRCVDITTVNYSDNVIFTRYFSINLSDVASNPEYESNISMTFNITISTVNQTFNLTEEWTVLYLIFPEEEDNSTIRSALGGIGWRKGDQHVHSKVKNEVEKG